MGPQQESAELSAAARTACTSTLASLADKPVGYPSSALCLLMELEAFRRRELEHPVLGGFYTQLLLSGGSATTMMAGDSADDEEEAAEVGCGEHFFWLEVLSSNHSGYDYC